MYAMLYVSVCISDAFVVCPYGHKLDSAVVNMLLVLVSFHFQPKTLT